MLTQKSFFEFVSATLRVFQGQTKDEVKVKVLERTKWVKEQVKAFELDLYRFDAEIQRRKKEIDQYQTEVLVYEKELEQYFGESK